MSNPELESYIKRSLRHDLLKHFRKLHWHANLHEANAKGRPTNEQLEKGTGLIFCKSCSKERWAETSTPEKAFIRIDEFHNHHVRVHNSPYMCRVDINYKFGEPLADTPFNPCLLVTDRKRANLKTHYTKRHKMDMSTIPSNLLVPFKLRPVPGKKRKSAKKRHGQKSEGKA